MPLPENWPVAVRSHSWVATIAVALALTLAGAFVFSLCHAERTAQATTQLPN